MCHLQASPPTDNNQWSNPRCAIQPLTLWVVEKKWLKSQRGGILSQVLCQNNRGKGSWTSSQQNKNLVPPHHSPIFNFRCPPSYRTWYPIFSCLLYWINFSYPSAGKLLRNKNPLPLSSSTSRSKSASMVPSGRSKSSNTSCNPGGVVIPSVVLYPSWNRCDPRHHRN